MEITHGYNGWILEDMDWDPEDGVSRFEYSRIYNGKKETWVTYRSQPTKPGHQDWDPFQKQGVFNARHY